MRLQQTLVKLEKQILRVTALRATDPQEKFNADDARELYAWIVPAILRFQDQLGPSYRARLKIPEAIEAATSVENRPTEQRIQTPCNFPKRHFRFRSRPCGTRIRWPELRSIRHGIGRPTHT
jgi:hypothetical protein